MTEPGSTYPPPPLNEPPAPPPGGPPPGDAPPPHGGAGTPPLPWEDRESHGFAAALIGTAKLLVVSPSAAFGRAKERGDYFDPLLFAVLMILVGSVFSILWGIVASAIFGPTDISRLEGLPSNLRPLFELLVGTSAAARGFQFLLSFAVPLIGLFLAAMIIHLFLLLVGGASASRAGFEGTFRVLCYSSVARLALILPLAGDFVTPVWFLVLAILGLAALHRTSHGKSAAAVLIPIVLCCVCIFAVIALTIGSLAAAMSGMQ